MSAIVGTADNVEELAKAHAPEDALSAPLAEKEVIVEEKTPAPHVSSDGREYPTEEEERTLRRVSDKVPWTAYTVAFVELCERFSYYGTIAVCMSRSGLDSGLSERLTMESTSHQLHPAATSSWIPDRCRPRGPVRRPGQGAARLHRIVPL